MTSAAGQGFTVSSELNISSCPITYFGQKYEKLYVNFTSENFVICFNGFYNPKNNGSCLVGPKEARAMLLITGRLPTIEMDIHQNIPAIMNRTLECLVVMATDNGFYTIANFGSETAFMAQHTSGNLSLVDILVDGTKVESLNVTYTEGENERKYADLSGCRHLGVLYRRGDVVTSHPQNCISLVCSADVVLQNTTCGPLEQCQGNGSCFLDAICTVTGPAVIDFHGQQNSVKDRCSYSLLRIPSAPGFQVLANFQERRRKDVSFLDSVTLQLAGQAIGLNQGGRVVWHQLSE
ncbi:PREDICTED: uncharacterized protein LOC107097433 [Cyprinodon variegatus]|uniref:uncharacterized protein LOC107097433 n=1 Tax=Cyprinodon variegatus TaxID=28743 RepID=UPI0007427EEA|nr:PREDICTED: uncharacterized protein LOC107097433 [Cyprinodon variegatus]